MASMFFTLQLHVASFVSLRNVSGELAFGPEMGVFCGWKNWNRRAIWRKFAVKALDSDDDQRLSKDAVVISEPEMEDAQKPHLSVTSKFQESEGSPPVFDFRIRVSGRNISFGLVILATMLVVVVVRSYATRNSRSHGSGSVAELVRRGQIRSDRRGISTPLMFEDPFNNPMVKVSKTNSTVEMCGKVYRLAPVTLTDEQQSIHKKRRSRAYQWKRPTVFLKEGDSVPPDVDPDTIRWIPANHPFATTSSDIGEDLAQSNVYQKHGVPFRIRAEHDALQKKLEALQNEQKLNVVIDSSAARDLEMGKKLQAKAEEKEDSSPRTGASPQSNYSSDSFGKRASSDEVQSS